MAGMKTMCSTSFERKSRVKICLATRCFDFRNAGIGRVSSEIQRVLTEKGYDITTVSTETGTSLYRYYWYLTWQMKNRLPHDSDVYHALTPMEAMWPPKRKTVVTFHDLFLITEPGKVGGGMGYRDFKRDVGRKFFEQACRMAIKSRFIVCVSEKTKQEVMDYFKVPEDKIRVIRSGINADLEPEPKHNSIFRIGYLGGLDRRKRVNLLIDAFRRTELKAQLLIGGTGLDDEMLKKQARGDTRIKFLGIVPDENLKDFYNSLDLFVFPTAQEGYGLPCLPPSEKILTLDGLKEISEVKQGDMVLTHTGMFRPVLKTLSRYTNEDLVEIRVWGNNTAVKLTGNHPVLAFSRPRKTFQKGIIWHDQIPTWIPASGIKVGDCVIFPTAEEIPYSPSFKFDLRNFEDNILCSKDKVFYKMGYSSISKKRIEVNRYIQLDKKLAKLLGYYIAEGSINSGNNGVVEFDFGIEPDLVSDTCQLLKDIFNVNPRVIKLRTKTRILISSQILNRFFSSLCGKEASNKQIPTIFLYGNTDLLSELIYGIWLGDGSKTKNTMFFSTASERLSYDLKIAITRIGFKPTVNMCKRTKVYKGRNKCSTEYTISYSLTNTGNHTHSNKSWHLSKANSLAVLVKEVKHTNYNGTVHNLEVHKDNSFTTRCFSVHNCVEAMACKVPAMVMEDAIIPEEIKSRCWITHNLRLSLVEIEDFRIPWQEKLDSNYEFAKSHNWDEAVNEYIKLYEEIADE